MQNIKQDLGANITLELWEFMNHDYQAFGESLPQAKEALARLHEVISKLNGEAG